MTLNFRINGKNMLNKHFSEVNINIDELEKAIFDITTLESALQSKDKVEDYNNLLYEIIGDKLNNYSSNDIVQRINKKKVHWKHPIFENIKDYLDEQDEIIVKPFEVSEGCIDCHKCGSNKIFLFQKQVRSADEGMTTFATCSQCGSKWSQ